MERNDVYAVATPTTPALTRQNLGQCLGRFEVPSIPEKLRGKPCRVFLVAGLQEFVARYAPRKSAEKP
jgi:hypothetical protein